MIRLNLNASPWRNLEGKRYLEVTYEVERAIQIFHMILVYGNMFHSQYTILDYSRTENQYSVKVTEQLIRLFRGTCLD